MKYYFNAFKRYADFAGRATRTEYWMFVLCNMVVGIAVEARLPWDYREQHRICVHARYDYPEPSNMGSSLARY